MAKELSKLFMETLGLDQELQTKLNKAQKTMVDWGRNIALAAGAITRNVIGAPQHSELEKKGEHV